MRVIGEELNSIVGDLYRQVLCRGRFSAPRGQRVLEYEKPVSIEVSSNYHPYTFIIGRRLNPYFAIAEAVWILSGRKDVSFISYFNKNISKFSDDGENFHGAYGDRLRNWPICRDDSGVFVADILDQIPLVVRRLEQDPNTRQAVLALWDPARDLKDGSKDYPCNNLVYFTLRGGKLDMSVIRRSNDAIWGLPYNQIQFYFLQCLIAGTLEVETGSHYEFVENMHVYVELYPEIYKLILKKVQRVGVTEEVIVPRIDRRISIEQFQSFKTIFFTYFQSWIDHPEIVTIDSVAGASQLLETQNLQKFWAVDVISLIAAYIAKKNKDMQTHDKLVEDIDPGLKWLVKDFNRRDL